jgi:serine protease DegS
MDQFRKFLQFASWPVFSGVLIAIVVLQYRQIQQLSEIQPVIYPPAQQNQQLSFSNAIDKAAPAVVSISATTLDVDGFEQTSQDSIAVYLSERASLGSGVIINEDGFIITNNHVIESRTNRFDTVVTLKDGRSSPATVVAFDTTNDLAILHINMDNLSPIPVLPDNELKVGDLVFAIGYPRNIGQSVSQGIVSALSMDIPSDSDNYLIQTDAAINPGNSGGALIDNEGNLIGINSSIFSESGRFEGIGFATPVDTAIRIMEELVAEAIANNPGYLGVLTGEVLNEVTSTLFFGVPDIRGMLVENVDEGGPAERAGIRPGDVITLLEQTPVIDEESIIMEVQNKRPGDQILVQVYREGQKINLPTTLGFGQAMVIAP